MTTGKLLPGCFFTFHLLPLLLLPAFRERCAIFRRTFFPAHSRATRPEIGDEGRPISVCY
jgi:hypothetical protein